MREREILIAAIGQIDDRLKRLRRRPERVKLEALPPDPDSVEADLRGRVDRALAELKSANERSEAGRLDEIEDEFQTAAAALGRFRSLRRDHATEAELVAAAASSETLARAARIRAGALVRYLRRGEASRLHRRRRPLADRLHKMDERGDS